MTDSRKRILFLCTGNAARSQMAEALARIDHGDVLDPVSAGSRPAGFVHPLAIRAIEELGFHMPDAYSKSAEEFRNAKFDLVVTVCASAAEDCPTWPGARHIVHWPVEDPSFLRGTEERRTAAFRATRDELRGRIDDLLEALRRPPAPRTDAAILERGAGLLRDLMQPHGFKLGAVREHKEGRRTTASASWARRGRALELQVRTGVAIASYAARDRRLSHPEYMERLGATPFMRYPGMSRDPLEAFRRLRADLARFGSPFLSGDGLADFARLAGPKSP